MATLPFGQDEIEREREIISNAVQDRSHELWVQNKSIWARVIRSNQRDRCACQVLEQWYTACYNSYTQDVGAPRAPIYCPRSVPRQVEACTCEEFCDPLRCCRQRLMPQLPPEVRSALYLRQKELAVPAGYRIYCPQPGCSAFLGASNSHITSSTSVCILPLICRKCNINVCVRCGQLSHLGKPCRVNSEITKVRDFLRSRYWQTCPSANCGRIVELIDESFHLTCLCGEEFCYNCAARWKTCRCLLGYYETLTRRDNAGGPRINVVKKSLTWLCSYLRVDWIQVLNGITHGEPEVFLLVMITICHGLPFLKILLFLATCSFVDFLVSLKAAEASLNNLLKLIASFLSLLMVVLFMLFLVYETVLFYINP